MKNSNIYFNIKSPISFKRLFTDRGKNHSKSIRIAAKDYFVKTSIAKTENPLTDGMPHTLSLMSVATSPPASLP